MSSNGDKNGTLALPATYIIGKDRKVLYHFVNADYSKRVESTDRLNALDTVLRVVKSNLNGEKMAPKRHFLL